MKTLIIIPARYGSTRFPGKPLALLGGKSMLSHVVINARKAAQNRTHIDLLVATDDTRIRDHCTELDVPSVMTPETCRTGTDRALAALEQIDKSPDFVINLQGDVPMLPASVISHMLDVIEKKPEELEVFTPVHQLGWDALDQMRIAKKETPFSGTTVTLTPDFKALWFSKNIIPAIRKEDSLRQTDELSPVWRHIGLYGYRTDILKKFAALPESTYEKLEGLEQLRLLENGISIKAVPVDIPRETLLSGIDSPEDLARAEEILKKQR
jgi:3-deoxy-manno-octulosonate cytidylyltransferase (CMP-KDO synthetase)